MRMRKCLLFMSLMIWCASVFGQTVNVKGKVTDITGEGLPGVSVIIKGITNGAITNIFGNDS